MATATVSIEALTALCTDALQAAGTAAPIARCVAAALVDAEARGLGSHGVARLPFYAAQVRSGKVDGTAEVRAERTAQACLRVDARGGFAFPAIRTALDGALAFLGDTGIAAAVIANSHHAGALGLAAEHAADGGAITLAFSNSPAGIAPWGGHRGVFGTNPIAFACPRRDHPPLIVDLSLSKVARGKVMQAHSRGEAIPEGWAIDASGAPTTDARAALDGTMLPIGDAKGSALALMVEILSAGLSGSKLGFEAGSFFTADGPAPQIGQSFILIDPEAFGGERVRERVETLLGAIAAQPGCRIPGQRRVDALARARADGIALDAALLDELRALRAD